MPAFSAAGRWPGMALSGRADLEDPREGEEIPLQEMLGDRKVYFVGKSYLNEQHLTFRDMDLPLSLLCTESRYDIGFRVVLPHRGD